MSRQSTPKRKSPNANRLLRGFAFLALALVIGAVVTVFLLSGGEDNSALSRGTNAYFAGDYTSAIQEYSAAIGQDPNNIEAFMGRGQAYLRVGNLEGARGDFQQAHSLDPNNTRPLYQLGLLALDAAEFPSAIAYFSDALAINPNYELALANRAFAYLQNGDYLLAATDYNAAIALNNSNANYYRGLGDAHFAIDNTTEALAAYERYVELAEEVDATVLQRIYELQNR